MAGYYYNQLNKRQRAVYEELKSGMEALAVSIRVERLEPAELCDVFTRLKLDEPLLFYAHSYSYRSRQTAEHIEFLPEYLYDKEKIREMRRAVNARVERLSAPIRKLPPSERELAIHDFIVEKIRYDKLKKPYSHEVTGPLVQGVGVCEGIAKTVKLLCDSVGLPCIIALSEAAPERGIKYRHAWNIVTVEGQSYHLDATFDNTLSKGTKRYDYFNLDDKHIAKDHERPVYPLPSCGDDKGFYYRRISLTKPEELERRFSQALRKKQEHFVFHWRGGGLNGSILSELLGLCTLEAQKKNKLISCCVNLPQAVIELRIGDDEKISLQSPSEELNE